MIDLLRMAELARRSYSEVTHICPGYDVEALVVERDADTTIAFRGTESVLDSFIDIITDLRVFPWYDGVIGGFCHAGFLKAARCIEQDLIAIVPFNKPLYITGHSYGGALAAITGARFMMQGILPTGIATFGAPRVDFGRVSKILRTIDYFRIVSAGDSVALLPPWPYRHAQKEITIPSPGMSDHGIDRYISGLRLYAGEVAYLEKKNLHDG